VHGGDWEWVGVGLNALGAPVFVAYSAHCAGTWRPWREAPAVSVIRTSIVVGGTADLPPSHPLSIVALGSHANYATPGIREPDLTSCKGARVAKPMRWLAFTAAAREETPDLGTFQIPAPLTQEETEQEATRPVWWGKSGALLLDKIELDSSTHGPASPALQGSAWTNPIKYIFPRWECDAGEGRCGAD
jgi:hypothetical protein